MVLNVGADRGYLLSEKGFQTGAVDVTRHTNVYLGSVAALKAATQGWLNGDLVRGWRERKSMWFGRSTECTEWMADIVQSFRGFRRRLLARYADR